MGLFAVNEWLIYYSSEIKQYSTEVALTLVALLVATGPAARTPGDPAATTGRRTLLLAVYGAIGVWFSFPLCFVLAAIGTFFVLKAALRNEWKKTLGFLAVSLVWAASFAVCYRVSDGILTKERFIWDWWDFAFLPLPPVARGSPSFMASPQPAQFAFLCADAPGSDPFGIPGVGPLRGGHWTLGRRCGGDLFIVIAPIPIAILASALHRYPFHGRLLLFLVRPFTCWSPRGPWRFRQRGRAATLALVFLLFQPAFDVMWHRVVLPREHGTFDSHGGCLPICSIILRVARSTEEGPSRETSTRKAARRNGNWSGTCAAPRGAAVKRRICDESRSACRRVYAPTRRFTVHRNRSSSRYGSRERRRHPAQSSIRVQADRGPDSLEVGLGSWQDRQSPVPGPAAPGWRSWLKADRAMPGAFSVAAPMRTLRCFISPGIAPSPRLSTIRNAPCT